MRTFYIRDLETCDVVLCKGADMVEAVQTMYAHGPFRCDLDDHNGAICEALRNHIDGTRELPQGVVEWIEGL